MVSDSPYRVRERRESQKRKRARGSQIQLGLGLDMARRTGKSSKVLAALLVAARSPQRPSVAGTPPERGEPVVWDLMIKYNGPVGLFT